MHQALGALPPCARQLRYETFVSRGAFGFVFSIDRLSFFSGMLSDALALNGQSTQRRFTSIVCYQDYRDV